MKVGVFGARGLVGDCVLRVLSGMGCSVYAYSRQPRSSNLVGVSWHRIDAESAQRVENNSIGSWICLAPIWVVPDYFSLFESYCARRIVAISSTSRFTKMESSDKAELSVASKLADAEMRLKVWAESKSIELVILRPTLIYGYGQDKNIAEIARFIQRFKFFPIIGQANGLRQPIHAEDVAMTCVAALLKPGSINTTYNITGGETLAYREMVRRIFEAMGYRPIILAVPLWLFSIAVRLLRILPRYRGWTLAMAERMNMNMAFDNEAEKIDKSLIPRKFILLPSDLTL
jgi:NAD dependent epimerase/dehydratase family enzyme